MHRCAIVRAVRMRGTLQGHQNYRATEPIRTDDWRARSLASIMPPIQPPLIRWQAYQLRLLNLIDWELPTYLVAIQGLILVDQHDKAHEAHIETSDSDNSKSQIVQSAVNA